MRAPHLLDMPTDTSSSPTRRLTSGTGPTASRTAVFALLLLCAAGTVLSPSAEAVEADLQLFAPPGPLLLGSVTFEARIRGEVDQVRFELDGEAVIQRRTPPYRAELFLGRLPRERVVTATALDADGTVLARDEMVVNRRPNVFRVRFLSPSSRAEAGDDGEVPVSLDVSTPAGEEVSRILLFVGEERQEELEAPPWRTTVRLSRPDRTTYLRAVAELADGNTTEAIRFVNAPDGVFEEVDVQYVQLYLSATQKRSGRPVLELRRDEIEVLEDGRPQAIRRFERVADLPLHLAVLLDVSASMAPRMEEGRAAAELFLRETLRSRDRAMLVTFNDRTDLRVELTSDPNLLVEGLADVGAMRGTALHDALVFALYQLASVRGQRAVLLFSDGTDESSSLRFEDALEYATRSGIPVYAVRLETERGGRRAREELRELARSTGGAAFFIDSTDRLPAVYRRISTELRSRYLATYQSDQGDDRGFREIEVRSGRRGIEVRTVRGYYPNR